MTRIRLSAFLGTWLLLVSFAASGGEFILRPSDTIQYAFDDEDRLVDIVVHLLTPISEL
jgi:hypothetical protein